MPTFTVPFLCTRVNDCHADNRVLYQKVTKEVATLLQAGKWKLPSDPDPTAPLPGGESDLAGDLLRRREAVLFATLGRRLQMKVGKDKSLFEVRVAAPPAVGPGLPASCSWRCTHASDSGVASESGVAPESGVASALTRSFRAIQRRLPWCQVWMKEESDLIQQCAAAFTERFSYEAAVAAEEASPDASAILRKVRALYGLDAVVRDGMWFLTNKVGVATCGLPVVLCDQRQCVRRARPGMLMP